MTVAIALALLALVTPAAVHADEPVVKWPTMTVPYWSGATNYAKEVKEAVRLWNASGVRIRFKAVAKSQARLRIVAANRAPGIGQLKYHGFTRVTARGRNAVGRIWVRTDFAEDSVGPWRRTLIVRVVAQELGHVIGLSHALRGCSVMRIVFRDDVPDGCTRPREPWRYRCRVLEPADLRLAAKLRGGRVGTSARAVCDSDRAPSIPANVQLRANTSEQTVEISWTNAQQLGSTASYMLVWKRSTCPSTAEIAQVVLGIKVAGVGVWDPVDVGGPGQRQRTTRNISLGTSCIAVVPMSRYQRPGTPVMQTIAVGAELPPPTAGFSYVASGLTVNFSDESESPDGYKPTSRWTFGDGATSTEENPSHSYGAPGTYTVTLVVTDIQGRMGETTKSVVVPG